MKRQPLTVTDEESEQLTQMPTASPELKTCYELKEAFRSWPAASTDRQTAATRLCEWQATTRATGLRSLQAFVKTLDNWRESILNYFGGRHSNGSAEGVNLKNKLLSCQRVQARSSRCPAARHSKAGRSPV